MLARFLRIPQVTSGVNYLGALMSKPKAVAAIARRPLGTPEEVADYLGVPVATLYAWRYQRNGKGPKSSKVGRHVRYRWADVEAWLDAQQSVG